MKINNIYYWLSLLMLTSVYGQGDLVAVASTEIIVQNGATLYVEGSVKLEDNTIFKNEGDIKLTKHWENNSVTNSFDATVINGNVHLIGGSQYIQGSNETHFYNLYLYNDYAVKECLINTVVIGRLHLSNAELQTHDNVITLINPNTNAITFNRGYVASDLLGGYLIRKTNSNGNYYFPVGNSLIDTYKRLRPVTIIPQNNSENNFAVRLAPLSPNEEVGTSITNAVAPYSFAQKQAELKGFNTLFYHNIARVNGTTPIDIIIWHEKQDGEYNTVAHWNSSEQWVDEKFTIEHFGAPVVTNFPLYTASVSNYNNFINDAFVLVNKVKIDNVYVPNTFTPNEDGNNDVFNPITTYENIQTYELTIFDRWGKQLFFTDNSTEGWNGLSQNKKLPTGTYVWMLKIKPSGSNANFIEKRGHINLIR